jgi:hypothetical protein
MTEIATTGREVHYLIAISEPVSAKDEQRILDAIGMIRGVIKIEALALTPLALTEDRSPEQLAADGDTAEES